jgi:hypothetical protein
VAGRIARLLLDGGVLDHDDVARRISVALSSANEPAHAAAWLEGFLYGSGLLLVHDERLLRLVDEWLAAHDPTTFTSVLPLVRRAFASFPSGERKAIGAAVAGLRGNGRRVVGATASVELDEGRAAAAVPVVLRLLGLDEEPTS